MDAYEKELMSTLPLTRNVLHKAEMEYHGKFGHTRVRIQRIAIMSRIDIFCATCLLATHTVSHTIPGFQVTKRCVQYLASYPQKPILHPSNYYDGLNVIILTLSGNKVKYYKFHHCLECHQYAYNDIILNIRQ